MITIAGYIIAFAVFLDSITLTADGFTGIFGFTRGSEVYGYYPFFIAILAMFSFSARVRWDFRERYVLAFFGIIIVSFGTCFFAGYDIGDVMKQTIGILLSLVPTYVVVSHFKNNLGKLFRIYLNVAIVVAIVGLFQEISWVLKFGDGYDYSWVLNKWWLAPLDSGLLLRINSVSSEPAHFAYALSPAVFASLSRLLGRSRLLPRFWAITVISAYLLTFSTLGYFGLLVMGFFFMWESGALRGKGRLRFVLGAGVLVPLLFVLASFAPGISERINDNIGVMMGTKDITAINPSAFALQSNLAVTRETLKRNPIFGTGLGTHARNYDQYIGLAGGVRLTSFLDEGLNKADANSLLLRLLSETGLLGTAAFLALVYLNFSFVQKDFDAKGRLTSDRYRKYVGLQVINGGCCIHLMLRLVRAGHYFILGFPLFLLLYIFSSRELRRMREESP